MPIYSKATSLELLVLIAPQDTCIVSRKLELVSEVSFEQVNCCVTFLCDESCVKVSNLAGSKNKLRYTCSLASADLSDKSGFTATSISSKLTENNAPSGEINVWVGFEAC